MRTRIALWGIAVLSMIGSLAPAQTAPASTAPSAADERLNRLEQRFNELEQKYQSDLKARDEEIARLKNQLDTKRAATTAPDEIEKTKQDVLKDIESRNPLVPTLRTPANFNPDIAVIGNFLGNVSTDNANPARNRFDLNTLEFEIRAPVDPRADAVAIIPFTREVEDPLFFQPPAAPDAGDVNSGTEIEEAYLFLHDFGVPNLTAKLGRFHLRFGRWNLLHNHDWPTSDNNFASQSFLGPEAIVDNGLSLSYVIPPQYVGNQYVELVAEVISGEGDDEQPVINNNAFIDSPALNTHILWNRDVARDWNIELGASWLTGKHNNNDSDAANLFGGDVTLIHTDPSGRFFNQVFQAEMIYGIVDNTPGGDTQYALGGWVLGQQQLNRDWYLGTRLDWTQNAVDEHQEVWAVSPYVSWYWSEFLRFRAEYQHKAGDTKTEDTLYLQATWVFGAHPPHPYWSMK
jgi:hypothetical protein